MICKSGEANSCIKDVSSAPTAGMAGIKQVAGGEHGGDMGGCVYETLGRSLMPFTERMSVPQNAYMILIVPKELYILFTLHSSMSMQLSGQKN